MTLVEKDGAWTNVDMVDLSSVSGGYPLFKWLWEPLGIPRAEWRAGAPWKLPLMREIQAKISAPRAKRNRDGKFRDHEGNLAPQLLEISVRGRRLKVLNDVRKTLVGLTESAETMDWFLAGLWQDSHPAVIQDHGDQPADDTPAPGDDDPATPGEPSDAPGATEANAAVEKALVKLRAHGAIRRVNFDKTNGRFRTLAFGPDARPRYFPIKQYTKLVKAAVVDMGALDMAINTAAEDAIFEHTPA